MLKETYHQVTSCFESPKRFLKSLDIRANYWQQAAKSMLGFPMISWIFVTLRKQSGRSSDAGRTTF